MSKGLSAGSGTECNRLKIGGTTELFGDPTVKPEKPYTIILFPGGSVEISRTTEGDYWVHVAVHGEGDERPGRIKSARLDPAGRYADAANAIISDEIGLGDVKHIAFLVEPGR